MSTPNLAAAVVESPAKIIESMICWCKQQGLVRATLHASEDGPRLYESLGFEASNEMPLNLR